MNRQSNLHLNVTSVALGLVIGGLGWVVSINEASAQGTDPLDINNQRTSDPFSDDSSGYQPFFDMMHRVQLGNIRSVSEYSQDQQEHMGSEAENFRMRQIELINQQDGQNSVDVEPGVVPAQQAMPSQVVPE